MHQKKHKRKVCRMLIFTSDATDAKMKQWKIRPWICNLLIVLICVLIGTAIGFVQYEAKIWAGVQGAMERKNAEVAEREADIASLQVENSSLVSEIAALNEKIAVLSEAVNQKSQDADELQQQLEQQSVPISFPLTGSAAVEVFTEGDPLCVFTGSEGTMVVATASGSVLSVEDDGEYGHKVIVDHGNGYLTIYRNKGEVKVKNGDSVTRGTTLYIVGADNLQLGYQMMKDGAYVNPMDVLSISG